MSRKDPPAMFALTEKALASSQLSTNNLDPIKMYVEQSLAPRRTMSGGSSNNGIPTPYGHSHGNGGAGGDDNASVRSGRSSRSRRASMSSALPTNMMGPMYGYDEGGDDTDEEQRSVHSSRSRRSNRRSSLSGALPSMLGSEDTEEQGQAGAYTNRPRRMPRRGSSGAGAPMQGGMPRRGSSGHGAGGGMPRRGSTGAPMGGAMPRRGSTGAAPMSGGMPRRGSNGAPMGGAMPRRGSNGAPMGGAMPRRGSSGHGANMPPPAIARRRGSAGFGAGYTYNMNSNEQVPMPRRMSNGMPMPQGQGSRGQGSRSPVPVPGSNVPLPSELKRFQTTDSFDPTSGKKEKKANRRSGGEPDSPKVLRNTTADSFEMLKMVKSAGGKNGSFTRRGGRREPDQAVEDTTNPAEQADESPSVSSNEEDKAEAEADDAWQPLQRSNTADSVDLMQMAQGARSAPKAGGATRRGRRRGETSEVPAAADIMQMGRAATSNLIEEEDDEEEEDDAFQPLQRNNTADSVDLMQMAQGARAAPKAGGATRRGRRRGETSETPAEASPSGGKRQPFARSNTADSMQMAHMSRAAASSKIEENEEDEDNDDDEDEDEDDAAFQPLQRSNTADSVDLMQMAQGARAAPKAGGATRRGRRRGAASEAPADEAPASGRRTIVRCNTADSMQMAQMSRAAKEEVKRPPSPLEGPPTSIGIELDTAEVEGPPTSIGINMTMSTGMEDDLSDPEEEVAVKAVPAADAESRRISTGVATNTRRGGRRGEDVTERRRTVQRHGTSNSLDTMRSALSQQSNEPSQEGENDETPEQEENDETPEIEASAPALDGINHDVLARMNHIASESCDKEEEVSDLDDDDEDDPYGYGKTNHALAYGYGNDAPSDTESVGSRRSTRSTSHAALGYGYGNDAQSDTESLSSRRSGRSMRRNSTIIRPDSSSYPAAEVLAGPPRVSDNDYGYGNDAPSDTESFCSRRSGRSMRRNSTVIRPDSSSYPVAEVLASPPPVAESDLEDTDASEDERPTSNALGYGYGYGNGPTRVPESDYGYGNDAPSDTESVSSRRSGRSLRRNSTVIRPDSSSYPVAEVSASPPPVADSDLEDTDASEDERPTSNALGYGYGNGPTRVPDSDYGYGNDAPSDTESVSSRRSGRSLRRNSTVIRPDSSSYPAAEVLASPPPVADSDLEDASEEGTSSGMYGHSGQQPPTATPSSGMYGHSGQQPPTATPSSGMYGYSGQQPPTASSNANATDSGNESDASMSSARRTRRRNSCLIRPEREPALGSSLLDNSSRMSDRDLLPELDDLNDPDSLLNRSGFGAKPDVLDDLNDPDSLLNRSGFFATRDEDFNDPDSLLNRSGFGATPKPQYPDEEEEDPLDEFKNPLEEVKDPPDEVKVKGIQLSSSNTAIKAKPIPNKKNSWGREQPFTSPLQGLTMEKLVETEKRRLMAEKTEIPNKSQRGNWGDVDLSMSDDDESSSDSSSDESFGASLYVDKSDGYRDIDRYKQKARRRASMELTCIDIDKFEPSVQMKTSKLPKFTPAVGCTNASDFIVRCFVARLRAGITVIKHNRSRWSKSHLRTLFLLPDGKTLSWRPAEGASDKEEKGKRPKLDLTRCIEVRHAWSKDPSTKKQTGTAIMRKRCKDGLASRSFALIFAKRTLDMTALTTDQCKLLMEGFTALCFRLHLDRMEDESHLESGCDNSRGTIADDDFASTIYGAGSTISLSLTGTTNTVVAPSAWGL